MENTETKFDFLVAAISDTQEIIRYIDAKAGVATLAIGGILTVIFSNLENICNDYCTQPTHVKVLLWAMAVGVIVSVYSLTKIIIPINKTYNKDITPRFYLTLSNNNKWGRLCPRKLDIALTIEEYQKQVENASEDDIIKSMTCELYAVSYIREVKLLRLSNLLYVLSVTVVIFILTFVLIK